MRSWREHAPRDHPADRRPGPRPLRRARPDARRQGGAERRARDLPAARDGAARQLDDRLRAEPRLGGGRSSASRTSSGCGMRSATTMRLDEADPVAAWQEHAATAAGARGGPRREAASTRSASAAPAPTSSSGCSRVALDVRDVRDRDRDRATCPNIPTEEVFTTPDWRRTEGVVRSTYPLVVPGVGRARRGARAPVRGRQDRGRPRGRRRRRRDPGDSSRTTRRRRTSARSRSSTAPRASARRGSSSATRSSTRTPPATSRTAAGCRSRSRGGGARAPTSSSSSASTSPRSTPTSWSAARGRGRRPRRGRVGDADHPRRRLGSELSERSGGLPGPGRIPQPPATAQAACRTAAPWSVVASRRNGPSASISSS